MSRNPREVNIAMVRSLIEYAYEMGYHEHGYDVLAELLEQSSPVMGECICTKCGLRHGGRNVDAGF